MSMNWGDIVGEPERIESAVSNLGGTTFIVGIALRLSSDIDRYRVPSQDWGVPCFFPVNPSSKLLPAKAVTGEWRYAAIVGNKEKERKMQGK